jgi:enoyl-CoA hydratase/carnithine racemase
MPYQFLLCAKREKVALLTLNRPDKRNALSIALRNEIDQCLAEIIQTYSWGYEEGASEWFSQLRPSGS